MALHFIRPRRPRIHGERLIVLGLAAAPWLIAYLIGHALGIC